MFTENVVSREDHLRRILNTLTLTELESKEVITVATALINVYRTNPTSFYGFPPDVPVSKGLADAFDWAKAPAVIAWSRVHALLVNAENDSSAMGEVFCSSVPCMIMEACECECEKEDDDDCVDGPSCLGWGLVDKYTSELAPVFVTARSDARDLKDGNEKVVRVMLTKIG